MIKFPAWRVALAALLFALAGQVAAQTAAAPQPAPQAPAAAAQPYNDAAVYRQVRSGNPAFSQVGVSDERGILIQSGGETWRQARVPVSLSGGLIVALAVLSLAAFYLMRGTIKTGESGSRQMIQRFQPADRYAHWFMAIVWVGLAISGLILSFGKSILLPIMGSTLFSWLAVFAKNLHNFTGPLLIIAVPWMFFRFLRHNWFGREDFVWLTKIVGNLTGHEYPSGKFNGGEKIVFWLLLVGLSTVLIVSGLIMNFPNFGQTRGTMQTVSIIHMGAAYLAIAMAGVHIYLGTIGMAGAYRAMRHGYVTAEWAKHHHELWYDDVKAGKVPESPIVPESAVPEPVRQAVLLAEK